LRVQQRRPRGLSCGYCRHNGGRLESCRGNEPDRGLALHEVRDSRNAQARRRGDRQQWFGNGPGRRSRSSRERRHKTRGLGPHKVRSSAICNAGNPSERRRSGSRPHNAHDTPLTKPRSRGNSAGGRPAGPVVRAERNCGSGAILVFAEGLSRHGPCHGN